MKHLNLAHIETSGLHLIEASAGTGKTWTIAALYILLLLEKQLRPEEILVVTYTKAATAELRDRIRTRIRETLELYSSNRQPADDLEKILLESRTTDRKTAVKLLTMALYSFDDAAIYTIHGFCQRALLENAFESGSLFDTEMITDQSALVDEVFRDFWRSGIMNEPDVFLKQLIDAGYTPEKLAKPFKGHYQDAALSIIPATDDPDLGEPAARCGELFLQLESLWQIDRIGILNDLAAARLNQRSYSPAQISTASEVFSQWLSLKNPMKQCDKLEFFTSKKIERSATAASTLPTHHFFTFCQDMFDTLIRLEQAFTEKRIHRQTRLHSWMKEELPRRKRAQNLRCFDDLLLDLHTALESGNGGQLLTSLRTRYRAALIDEFQDTDPLQWQIFSRLAGLPANPVSAAGPVEELSPEICPNDASYPLYLIGDPKQAIYSFRGADIFAYIAAARSVHENKRATLDTNRRSVKPLVNAVNALFGAEADPFRCRAIEFSPVKSGRDAGHCLLENGEPVAEPLRFRVYPRDNQTAAVNKGEANRTIIRCVAAEIARLLDGSREIIDKNGRRKLTPGDIAVLVKAHYQADLVQKALREQGIPSVQHGSSTIFESDEAMDLLRIIRAAAEPARERLVREALLTGTMCLTANQVAEYLGETGDDRPWEQWLLRFRGLQETARTGGVIALAERLLGECGVRRRALGRIGGERILTNVLHCVELLHQAEREQGLSLEGLVTWLERRITRREKNETALLRLETDANAVQLSTIHASKGLEYPVVFLPFAWDSPSAPYDQLLFHDDSNRLILDLGSDQQDLSKSRAAGERAAEAARSLYVALTRAEFLCYVDWGCINGAQNSPLFPLLHGRTVPDPKEFKSYPDQDILNDIRLLSPPGNVLTADLLPVDIPAPPYQASQEQITPFTCLSLSHAIRADWRVSSFSGLTAGVERSPQPRDYDVLNTLESEGVQEPSPRPTGHAIYDFPRGAAAGTCLHEILQRLNFAELGDSPIEQTIRACLLAAGYDEQWLPAVLQMTREVSRAELIADAPGFSLGNLNKGDWQPELEFFLPIMKLSPELLRQLFDGLLDPELHGRFSELLTGMHFQQSCGMLHGFMDLVFQHDGRYYIIDWKSNHLGFSDSDYAHAGMARSMADHSYILQYHLYSLALDRHLRLHLPGYSYETHFGGAIYVYLRGVNAENPHHGIYRDKPSAEFIRRANELLLADIPA
ncbi:MAG: exodeoxyribonuclease V subunit beta [Geobacteraceae bacterium]|nr:exodeoxyribonuclease V subunit beta [Geobacteraceae bacterium]